MQDANFQEPLGVVTWCETKFGMSQRPKISDFSSLNKSILCIMFLSQLAEAPGSNTGIVIVGQAFVYGRNQNVICKPLSSIKRTANLIRHFLLCCKYII